MAAKLKCPTCGYEQDAPKHCNRPMQIEKDKLVCWMGADCGTAEIPQHCGAPMRAAA
ncbi:MAG TPA: hypothetical protein VMH37_07885 [Candidatus Binataceae bacterium]|nr:hypothetical protein [Candidatus Binataceae bacterium]